MKAAEPTIDQFEITPQRSRKLAREWRKKFCPNANPVLTRKLRKLSDTVLERLYCLLLEQQISILRCHPKYSRSRQLRIRAAHLDYELRLFEDRLALRRSRKASKAAPTQLTEAEMQPLQGFMQGALLSEGGLPPPTLQNAPDTLAAPTGPTPLGLLSRFPTSLRMSSPCAFTESSSTTAAPTTRSGEMLAKESAFDARCYSINPNVPKRVIQTRLRAIDRRLREIDTALAGGDESYKAQELQHERATLLGLRRQAESIFNPPAVSPPHPTIIKARADQRARDQRFLKAAIKERRENLEWSATREEAAGNHRQARLWREQMPLVPEAVCAEYGMDIALLEEIESEQAESEHAS